MTNSIPNPLVRCSATIKVLAAIGLILVITLTPVAHPDWLAAEGAMLVLFLLFARVSFLFVVRRLLWLSPFVAGAALAAAFSANGTDWKILALRSSLCLAAVITLSQTTTFSELLAVFRAARVPALLITTLALMHRYLHVLADESARMQRARAARTFTNRSQFVWLTAASVVGQLFVRASERAERVYDAMCARGWKT